MTGPATTSSLPGRRDLLPTLPGLITYPDSLGGDLASIARLLGGPLAGAFASVHVLPPFPASGDRGFAVTDHSRIDPRFGGWSELAAIGRHAAVVLDLIANHVGRQDPMFQDFLALGTGSPFAPLFLRVARVFPNGPSYSEFSAIFRRRTNPFSTFEVGPHGEPVELWTTFGRGEPSDMIDLDLAAPETRHRLRGDLERFAANGVRGVRLDAVAFTTKVAGTSCFMAEPAWSEIMGWFESTAGELGLDLIGEVHAPRPVLDDLARWSRPYDFAFPTLCLEALTSGEGDLLATYLPTMQPGWITTLDSHDGIPVQPDLDGTIPLPRLRAFCDAGTAAGGRTTTLVSTTGRPDPTFAAHQLCVSLIDLLGSEDALFAARALQLWAPGLPQVYYQGLLGGRNDHAAVEATGDSRSVNRHDYPWAELDAALGSPFARRMLELLRARMSSDAFTGPLVVESRPGWLRLSRSAARARAVLDVDLRERRARIDITG